MDADAAPAPPPLERIVEALLFVGGGPLTAARAGEVVRGLAPDHLAAVVAGLDARYRQQGRPYRIRASGPAGPERTYEMEVRPAFRPVLQRLQGAQREVRLSPPALDTLALVAYHQPIGREAVDNLRGGDSLALLRQLVRLGLIAVQRPDGNKGEALYVTTRRSLELLDLRSLEDLPRPQDLPAG